MRILITNDDGMLSPVLPHLVKWAKKLGEVTVIVPKTEQSGKSHAINLVYPFEIAKFDMGEGVDAYYVDSTPADCVRYAMLTLKLECDLVISGINKGYNVGEDIVYSGTVGACFEASYFDVRSLAISTSPETFENALDQLDRVYDYIIKNDIYSKCDILNVNIPPAGDEILITRQGGANYLDIFVEVEKGMYLPKGDCIYVNRHDHTIDADAVSDGYISISPLTIERTNVSVFEELSKKLNAKK